MGRTIRPALLRRCSRTALLWLLAVVVPLQCSAGLVRIAAGPMHSHAAPAASVATTASLATLRDFRRDIGRAAVAADAEAPAVLATLLHGHTHPQRHHHRAGDGGIALAGDSALERIDSSDDGGGNASGAFAGLLPLVGSEPALATPASTGAAPTSTSWAASSCVAAMPERPPRV